MAIKSAKVTHYASDGVVMVVLHTDRGHFAFSMTDEDSAALAYALSPPRVKHIGASFNKNPNIIKQDG